MNTRRNQLSHFRHLARQSDLFAAYVLELPAFRLWWRTVDQRFGEYTGLSAADLPIPDQTWRLWWQEGITAQRVADLLAFYLLECVA